MKIGIFSECYEPTLNGVVVSVNTFKTEIEKRGHEVFIFAPATHGFVDKDTNHTFRYPSTILFGPNDYPVGIPIFSPKITKIAKKLDLDIIHAQHSLGMISKLSLKIARQKNIPIIHTYHTLLTDYIHWKIASNVGKWYVKKASTTFCNRCDQIIAPSPSMKNILLEYGVKKPIEPIPTGIDLECFKNPFSREEIFEKYKIPKNKKLLLYLARIAYEKNIDFLFSAVTLIKQKRKDFHLVMAGGGKELNDYKNKAKKDGLSDIITFTGKLKKKDAERMHGVADIFVFPSISETQGIVISEAMASGIPAVAVGIMGPKDIINNNVNGFLTKLNLSEFSAKIEHLLENNDLRKKMGNQAKIDAEKFSINFCADKLEKIYAKTINNYSSKQ